MRQSLVVILIISHLPATLTNLPLKRTYIAFPITVSYIFIHINKLHEIDEISVSSFLKYPLLNKIWDDLKIIF